MMKNDDVYSLGSNSSGCLGVDSVASTLTPIKVCFTYLRKIREVFVL